MLATLINASVVVMSVSVMLAVGCGFQPSEVRSAWRARTTLAVAVLGNIVLFPALAWMVLTAFAISQNTALGVMLCCAGAGGVSGLLFARHGHAHMPTALLVYLLINVCSLLSVPIILVWLLPADQSSIGIFAQAITTIIFFQLIPFALGAGLRRWRAHWAVRCESVAKRTGDITLLFLVVALLASQGHRLSEFAAMDFLAMALIFLAAVGLARLTPATTAAVSRAVLYVIVVRNINLALLLATQVVRDDWVTLSALTYSLFIFIGAALMAWQLPKPNTASAMKHMP